MTISAIKRMLEHVESEARECGLELTAQLAGAAALSVCEYFEEQQWRSKRVTDPAPRK